MAIDKSKGARLKQLREDKNLTQEALGAALSPQLSKQQIYKMESGRHRITAQMAVQLAPILGVGPETLADEAFLVPSSVHAKLYDRGRGWAADGEAQAAVGIYDVQIAGGDGAYIDESRRTGDIAFDRAWLRTLTDSPPSRLSILQLYGSSMEPTIPDGSWVMIDLNSTKPINNKIFAIQEDDEARIKRISINPQTKTVSLLSDNPTWPAIRDLEPSRLKFYGRVIWFSKKL